MNLWNLVVNAFLALVFVFLIGVILIVVQSFYNELRNKHFAYKQARRAFLLMKKEEKH